MSFLHILPCSQLLLELEVNKRANPHMHILTAVRSVEGDLSIAATPSFSFRDVVVEGRGLRKATAQLLI